MPSLTRLGTDRAIARHAALTQRITGFYEEAIRARPDCWLWSYRRWRHIPEGTMSDGFPSYAKPQGD